MNNKALLIGVPEYKRANNINIDVVRNDVRLLRECWNAIGIASQVHCPDTAEENAKTAIEDIVSDFFEETDERDTVFLYWSGHGGHIRGRDYLLCADYDPNKLDKLKERSFALSDLLGFARTAKAKNVIIFVDACREKWDLQFRDNAKNAGGLKAGVHFDLETVETDKIIAILSSCSTDEFSYFPNECEDGDAVSYFTQGLIQAFSAETKARTFLDVKNHIQNHLNQIQIQFPDQTQTVKILAETNGSELNELVVARSPDSGKLDAIETNPWVQKVFQSQIWSQVLHLDEEQDRKQIPLADVQLALRAVIGNCWFYFDAYRKTCSDDPWHDESYPVRFVETLKTLLRAEGEKLRPSELGIAIATPFILEAVISSIKASKFASLSEVNSNCLFKNRFDIVKSSMPQWTRKINSLERISKLDEATWIDYWLANIALFRSPEFRLEFMKHIKESKVFDFSKMNSSELLSSVISSERVSSFLKQILSSTDSFIKNEVDWESPFKFGRGDYHSNDAFVQTLLKYASILTLDIRKMPPVVPDHLGVEYPVNLDICRQSLADSFWDQTSKILTLSIATTHPAFDSAVLDIVEEADREYQKLVTSKKNQFVNLPTRLTPDQVIIRNQGGAESFSRPHLKFTLAQDEIRELLMGVELYGEPELALRELYQNAIDAIRYREARIKFLEKENPSLKYNYEPKIIFRQDKDADGREYIECIDNGVGMDRQIFSSVFAKAGRRFSEMSDFVEEQKQWDKHDIKLYPNSQFGVGVLSYFMLADHIEVETTRFEKDGKIGETITASITGSGNLFRIKSSPPSKFDYGTRIRLYLKICEELSVQEVLSTLIHIPEYDLEIEMDGAIKIRKAGEIKRQVLPTGVENVWWCSSDDAEILSDGVRIGKNAGGPGFLYINLKGENKPRLSIDRKTLRLWREDEVIAMVAGNEVPNLNPITKDERWFERVLKSELGDRVCSKLSNTSSAINIKIRWEHVEYEMSSDFIAKYGFNLGDLEAISKLNREDSRHSFYENHTEVSYFRACEIVGEDLPEGLPENFDEQGFSKLKQHKYFSSAMQKSLKSRNFLSIIANLSWQSGITINKACDYLRGLEAYNIVTGIPRKKNSSDRVLLRENFKYFDWDEYDGVFNIPADLDLMFYLEKLNKHDVSPVLLLEAINWLSDFSIKLIDEVKLEMVTEAIKQAKATFFSDIAIIHWPEPKKFTWPTSFVEFDCLDDDKKRSIILRFVGNTNLNWSNSIALFKEFEEIMWDRAAEKTSTQLLPYKLQFEITPEHRGLLQSVNNMKFGPNYKRYKARIVNDLKSIGVKS